MNAASDALWARLREAGLVEGDVPPDAVHMPWYVRVMMGFAGWIGALFLMGFVGAAFAVVYKVPASGLVIGALMCGGATALFRAKPDSDFFEQFGLAVSLAGQGLMGYGLGSLFAFDVGTTALLFALVEVALFLLIPSFLHRVISAAAAGASLVVAATDWGFYHFTGAVVFAAFAWAWLNEFRLIRRGVEVRSFAYGMTLLVIGQLVMLAGARAINDAVLGHGRHAIGGAAAPWIGPIVVGIVFVVVVWRLLARQRVAPGSGPGLAALAGALVVAVVSLKAPGFGVCVAIVLLGHAHGNHVLSGLGIAALVAYWSWYYYSLEITLLEKSAVLAGAGVVLVLARLAMNARWPRAGAKGAGDA
ncbi:MAG TPA: DUF4401 domain-containing protein [Burkholderiales bacterium]|nr:DUF4401 domain-containing protein [Burkholderiales bacterium]